MQYSINYSLHYFHIRNPDLSVYMILDVVVEVNMIMLINLGQIEVQHNLVLYFAQILLYHKTNRSHIVGDHITALNRLFSRKNINLSH